MMKDTTSNSIEEVNSSDHDRSFERTRGSYISCINRSLEHAFDFLSETGYASGGMSDADRVDSRDDNDHTLISNEYSGEFLHEINSELRKSGVAGEFLFDEKKEFAKKLPNIVEDIPVNHSLNAELEMSESKNEPQNGDVAVVKDLQKAEGNIISESESEIEGLSNHKERIVYKTDSDQIDGVMKEKNGPANGGVRDDKRRIAYRDGERKNQEMEGKGTMPYLTTERMIFKQMFNNAKETEQLKNDKKSNKNGSNLESRESPKKSGNSSPSKEGHSSARGKNSNHKGFKRFRESFRRKSSRFLPQKFAVQEDKKSANDIIMDANEFEYHSMQISRDNDKPINDSDASKKRSFLGHLFHREKPSKFRQRNFFRSSDMINQMRAHSRDNLSSRAERPKSISLFIDKIRNQFTENRLDGSTGSILDDVNEDLIHNGRHLSNSDTRFRRCVSLRSIPSVSGYGVASQQNKQSSRNLNAERESLRILRSSQNRPISCHDLLSRDSSVDSNGSADVNIHKVLRNRLSCCSFADNSFNLRLSNHSDYENEDNGDAVFASSPRRDDDITEWIRGLQYSSAAAAKTKEAQTRRAEKFSDIYESMDYLKYLQQTRLVNGQIQTYL